MELEQILILLVVLPPFAGAILGLIVDQFWEKFSRYFGVFTITISGLIALFSFIRAATSNWEYLGVQATWWISGLDINLLVGFKPDQLGLMMAVVAAFLGMLIAIFSLEYMAEDDHLSRYWFYLQLFIGGMVLLVISGDLVTMYVGWEVVGLCSFGLIAHYHNKMGDEGQKAGNAGIKAFIFTRIGDIGFLVAIVIMYQQVGAVDFETIMASTNAIGRTELQLVSFLFLLAAFGKSAQFPFIPWLSSPEYVDVDAMQGPTTVSALIHAATMVKAGVYLMARLYLLIAVNNLESFVWTFVVLASVTAFIAALSALVSYDIKRILAFSTVSQLAYMFMGLALAFSSSLAGELEAGGAAFLSSQAHLLSHAVFKSLLFLTAGYLIHSYGSRDIRKLQGVAGYEKDMIGFAGLLTGGLALAGVPPLNGFFSKEAIIGSSFYNLSHTIGESHAWVIYIFGLATAIITALYVGRMFYYLFLGGEEDKEKHEGNVLIMQIVIVILSVISVLGGLLQLMLSGYFADSLDDAGFHKVVGTELLQMILVTILVVGALSVIFLLYKAESSMLEVFKKRVPFKTLYHISYSGFYLENVWQRSWSLIKSGSYSFRKFHSGRLNDMMLIGTITVLIVLIFVIGGI